MIVDEKILYAIVDKWGMTAQIDMLHEEIGELLTAINQHKRDRVAISHVQEEIADCLIMLQQMRVIYGRKEVDEWIRIKIKRVEGRLADPEREVL